MTFSSERFENPIAQAVLIVLATFIVHLLLMSYYGIQKSGGMYHWVVSATSILVYGIFNTLYLLKTKSLISYLGNAILGLFIVVAFGYGLAVALSEIDMQDQRSIRWIFFLLIFCYFVLLAISLLIRKIIGYAKNQDSSQP